jgi:hypothetical protein
MIKVIRLTYNAIRSTYYFLISLSILIPKAMRVTHEERIISAYVRRLQKVSNYARAQGISAVEVYRRIDAEKIEGVKIDGVAFVVLPPATESAAPPRS